MSAVTRNGIYLITEAVYDIIHQIVFADQRNLFGFTVVHIEHTAGKFRQVEIGGLRCGIGGKDFHLLHPIHPEGAELSVLFAVTDGIVMILVPYQTVGGEEISLSIVIGDFFSMLVVVKVPERNLLPSVDCRIDIIYQIVNLLVQRFYSLGNIQIAFQLRRLMDAGHLRQLFDQLRAFLYRDEFGRFHRINQQFQLRQSK